MNASQELKSLADNLDWDKIKKFGCENGLNWKFSPPDSPWWNGCAEALVRSVKKAISHMVGECRLTFNELQTIFFECANLVNKTIVIYRNLSSLQSCKTGTIRWNGWKV